MWNFHLLKKFVATAQKSVSVTLLSEQAIFDSENKKSFSMILIWKIITSEKIPLDA